MSNLIKQGVATITVVVSFVALPNTIVQAFADDFGSIAGKWAFEGTSCAAKPEEADNFLIINRNGKNERHETFCQAASIRSGTTQVEFQNTCTSEGEQSSGKTIVKILSPDRIAWKEGRSPAISFIRCKGGSRAQVNQDTISAPLSEPAGNDPDLLCTWTINDKKDTKFNEEYMKGPCSENVLSGTKFFASSFEAQGRKFKVEYLEEPQGIRPFKARVNGKIGTMKEENRYSKSFTSDDLYIEFSYDAVVADKRLTRKMIQGSWAKDHIKNCSSNIFLTVRGNTLSLPENKRQCEIYKIGKTTTVDIGMFMMKCKNDSKTNYEAWSFEVNNKGNEAYSNGLNHYFKCSM